MENSEFEDSASESCSQWSAHPPLTTAHEHDRDDTDDSKEESSSNSNIQLQNDLSPGKKERDESKPCQSIIKSTSLELDAQQLELVNLNDRRFSDSRLAAKFTRLPSIQADNGASSLGVNNSSISKDTLQLVATNAEDCALTECNSPKKKCCFHLLQREPRKSQPSGLVETTSDKLALDQTTSPSEDPSSSSVTLFDVAWEDILFLYIFPNLGWRDLFSLRSVSQIGYRSVQAYFAQMKDLDLTDFSRNFSPLAFQVVTENCRSLRRLIIPEANWVQDTDLIKVFKSNPQLRHVDLGGCSQLKGPCLLSLAVNCKLLRILSLRDCTWMTQGAVETLIAHLRSLRELDFTSCATLNNYQIFSITQAFPCLVRLHLAQIQAVNDSTLVMIARNCRELAHLDIRACMCVTDNGIRAISDYCQNLKTLKVEGCHLVTEYSLTVLRSRGTVSIDRPASDFFLHMPAVLIPRVQV